MMTSSGIDGAGSAPMRTPEVNYLKADGTGNDFVVILDIADELAITSDDVRQWCDRASGIGADGLLRIVRRADGTFFMDYRNGDGSLAETCGNGLRVVAHVLRSHALLDSGVGVIGTRGGDVRIAIPVDGDITVEMGCATSLPDALTVSCQNGLTLPAQAVLMPNPHAIAWVDDVQALGDLSSSPTHDPAHVLPDGANYEFIQRRSPTHIRMRVFERGVGETKSCGSGACAAAVVAAADAGLTAPWEMRVDVPGGALIVAANTDGLISLTGPAQVTGSGTIHVASNNGAGSHA